MDRLVADQAFVADPDPKGVKEDQRMDRLQRPGLPGGDFLRHSIRHRADQIRRQVDAADFARVPGDLAGAHAARGHRDDLVIEPGKPALVPGDEPRIEARLPIPRRLQLEPAAVSSLQELGKGDSSTLRSGPPNIPTDPANIRWSPLDRARLLLRR